MAARSCGDVVATRDCPVGVWRSCTISSSSDGRRLDRDNVVHEFEASQLSFMGIC